MPSAPSPSLTDLARQVGIATEFWDWQGRHTQVSAESIRAVLAALDIDASTEEATHRALHDRGSGPWRRVLPPTVVMREGWTPWVPVHVPHGADVSVEIELEDGSRRLAYQVDHWVEPREVDGHLIGEATFELPGDLPLGWHRLHARVAAETGNNRPIGGLLAAGNGNEYAADAPSVASADSSEANAAHPGGLIPSTATATLIVTPQRLTLPAALEERAATGLMTQLYQVRSHDSWGIGDLHDLASLARWSAHDLGADFVLVNPLHAAEPITPVEASPYLPTSRRFINPIYLHVEDIPEVATLDPAALAKVEAFGQAARALDTTDTIDRDAAWPLKRAALEVIHAAGLTGRRAKDYRRFLAREGQGLVDFATWCAIADLHGLPDTSWPESLSGPGAGGIPEFRAAHAHRIDFFCWLQWVLDRQLGEVQRAAKEAGMALGVVSDLAVGVHPYGADAWGLAYALASGVTVGAPPDQFNQLGQNWSQPPWRPDRLADLGYAPFRDMVRTVLRDSGGLRVDHVIGLFRLWWIPGGQTPADGTYVTYDHEALIGILVLEAQRAGAVVIGEDLGVVEPWTRDYLRERGILGTSILWFEWADGQPMPPERYRDLCLTCVTTHDLPPTAGYLNLEHVDVRDRLGLLTRSADEERAAEQHAIDTVRHLLVERGLLAPDGSTEDMTCALHAWLAQTPSRLLAYALADLVGDRRAVNQPGTDKEYPNWRVPLTGPDGQPLSLAEVMAAPLAPRIAAAVRGQRAEA